METFDLKDKALFPSLRRIYLRRVANLLPFHHVENSSAFGLEMGSFKNAWNLCLHSLHSGSMSLQKIGFEWNSRQLRVTDWLCGRTFIVPVALSKDDHRKPCMMFEC